MSRQIVTILSTNYAGSHFLSLMLGSHLCVAHIGEVRSLRRAYRKPRVPCHLCDDLSQCPIVRGVTPGSIDNVYDTIFNNIDDANLDALVDTSKQIDWARRFVGHKRYRIRYIHLVRDPRALVRRWTQLYTGSVRKRWHERWKAARRPPGSFASLLTGRQWRVYLSRWLTENQRISRFIRRYDLDAAVVTYRDAALEPEPTVRRIMTWLELSSSPGNSSTGNSTTTAVKSATTNGSNASKRGTLTSDGNRTWVTKCSRRSRTTCPCAIISMPRTWN